LDIFCIYWSSFFLNQPCREIIDSEDNSHATSGDEWKPSEAASETDVSVQLPKLSTTTSHYRKKRDYKYGCRSNVCDII
jgi:hypothetical protein